MSRKMVAIGSAVLFALSSSPLWAANESGQPQNQARQSEKAEGTSAKEAGNARSNAQQAQTPEGFVLVDERVVYLMANEPQNHFVRARAELAAKHYHSAASEVRIAAAYFDMQASRNDAQDKSALDQEAKSLRSLAREISSDQRHPGATASAESRKSENAGKEENAKAANGKTESAKAETAKSETAKAETGKNENARPAAAREEGQSVDIARLDRDFAEANSRLAQSFQAEAEQALNAKKFIRAGHELYSSATCLRQAMAWSGEKPEADRRQVIENSLRVANNLMGENVWSAEKKPVSANANPANGTTKAEAKNTVEYAREMTTALGKEIDQCAQSCAKNSSQSEGQTAAFHEGAGSKSAAESGNKSGNESSPAAKTSDQSGQKK